MIDCQNELARRWIGAPRRGNQRNGAAVIIRLKPPMSRLVMGRFRNSFRRHIQMPPYNKCVNSGYGTMTTESSTIVCVHKH